MVLVFVQSRSVWNNLENNKYKWCKVMGSSLFQTKMMQLYAQINTQYYARMTVKCTVSKNITFVPIPAPTHYVFIQFIVKRKQRIGQRACFCEPVSNSFLKPAGLQKVVHRTKSFCFKHHWQCTCYLQHIYNIIPFFPKGLQNRKKQMITARHKSVLQNTCPLVGRTQSQEKRGQECIFFFL
uniref:Uncharacterized protein n=1 Tax=Rhipicephalus zambeziensis TaxID=60191 RepID=A0A224YAM0_9ACAR